MKISPHDKVLIAGQLVDIGEEIASAYSVGDRLIAVPTAGLLRIPKSEADVVRMCIDRAIAAFEALSNADDSQISHFYSGFMKRLNDDDIFANISAVNERDVERAKKSQRSTTRLILSDSMRSDMVEALHMWELFGNSPVANETITHDGWNVESLASPLGVVGFVFEGRPNVFADATGVMRSRNVCIFRIGSDAFETAEAIMNLCVIPSLAEAGLPTDCVILLPSKTHASAWALFSDRRLSLAVARGSGASVALLGEIAQQHGIPSSLHGTGGAWMVVSNISDGNRLKNVIRCSLDRKVCNTLNTVVMTRSSIATTLQVVIDGIVEAANHRNARANVHVDTQISEALGSISLPSSCITVPIDHDSLNREWEWENDPEVSIVVAEDVQSAIQLFNRHSPSFVLSIISDSAKEVEEAWRTSNAPFFGDGMTRWVDGQYALQKPELGLSNWQNGRTFARGGILSGDSIFTIRYRMRQSDPNLKR